MTSEYDALVKTGFVPAMKRDVLLEATRDIEYVCHIVADFRTGSAEAEREAIPCSVRLIEELIAGGLCELGVFSGEPDKYPDALEVTHEELVAIVARSDENAFEHFLVTTERGQEWVARYLELLSEL